MAFQSAMPFIVHFRFVETRRQSSRDSRLRYAELAKPELPGARMHATLGLCFGKKKKDRCRIHRDRQKQLRHRYPLRSAPLIRGS